MKIIRQNPAVGGTYPPIQTGEFSSVPSGMALWPDDLSTDEFYAHNGFVTLDIQEVDGTPTVVSCVPNTEAWEAWKATLIPDEEPEREPTDMDKLAAAYVEGVNEA